MKTLKNYISEKLVINKQVDEKLLINKDYKNDEQYFIYDVDDEESKIAIFDNTWPQFNDYKDKVYINGEHVEITNGGFTTKGYSKGIYKVEIKDIDKVENCASMFLGCWQLVEAPYFNTKKVKTMNNMFYHCINLEEVSLFDTSKVTEMHWMFYDCNDLSDKTKQRWSKVYDFNKNDKK